MVWELNLFGRNWITYSWTSTLSKWTPLQDGHLPKMDTVELVRAFLFFSYLTVFKIDTLLKMDIYM